MSASLCGGLTIVSGGQTGVDRAALQWACAHGVPYEGWCPAGGWAQDATTPPGVRALFPRLRPTLHPALAHRTACNVRDSDATLVIAPEGVRSPGTQFTLWFACYMGRAHVHCTHDGFAVARRFVRQLPPRARLNVAGPRLSEAPGIDGAAYRLLDYAFGTYEELSCSGALPLGPSS